MERYIEVTGSGTASQVADEVQIHLTLSAKNKDYSKVQAEANDKLKELIAMLEKLGFSQDALKTTNYSLNTYYEQNPKSQVYQTVFAGYQLSHGLMLHFPHNHAELNKLLKNLTMLTGKPEFQLSFTFHDPKALQVEARQKAIADAKAKAEEIAQVSGVTLGDILQITESDHGYSGGMSRKMSFAMDEMANIPVGEHDVSQTVRIRFAIA